VSEVTTSAHVVQGPPPLVPGSPAAASGRSAIIPTVGPETGFRPLEQHVILCAPGTPVRQRTGAHEQVLFVLAGQGTLSLDGETHALEPESGVYLPPDSECELETPGPETLQLVSVRIPEPAPAGAGAPPGAAISRLADQATQDATTDREFRIVADPETGGLRSATHFVGYIPLVRAPDHFHTYDEVIYVLDGEGLFRSGGVERPLGPGSCIQLPARTVHCLENTGTETMRVVAVFRPAGSPAAAYYPDGTPAYGGAPPREEAT
jgi:quercetin dioxygenase-like cupin family protein